MKYLLPNTCPHCGAENEVARGMRDRDGAPDEGAVSICWSCNQVSVFTDGEGHLRKPTPQEREEILADPLVIEILCARHESQTPSELDQKVRRV